MAADIAPGLERDYFGFLGWRGHNPEVWHSLKEDAIARRHAGLMQLPSVIGYDADRPAIRAALENIAQAGLSEYIHVERRELGDSIPPKTKQATTGLLVTNPPYLFTYMPIWANNSRNTLKVGGQQY